jgi:DNA-directed RNA polymerase subunit RPC12/RpoP
LPFTSFHFPAHSRFPLNIRYTCPRCSHTVRHDLADDVAELGCPQCGHRHAVPPGALAEGQIARCVVCPSRELFVRKDFPRRLGLSIMIAGFAASCVTLYYNQVIATYAILFGTVIIDAILYVAMGDVLECYRCHAEYRGAGGLSAHGPFHLETHERGRQQAARMAESPAGEKG